MFYKTFILLTVAFFMTSCGEAAKFSNDELAQQQQAWDTMMEGHDRVMPKMDDLYQASKALEAIAKNSMVAADNTHPRAMEAMKYMESAEDGMMDWMANIGENMLSALRTRDMDHTAVMAFIASEQTKIEAVEEAMENSLKQAEALIREKTGN